MDASQWQCPNCHLSNDQGNPHCMACGTLNDEYKKCSKCASINMKQNISCMQCFNSNNNFKNAKASQLHLSISPDDTIRKELLTYGYNRLQFDCNIADINKIFLAFYDESMQWKVSRETLKTFSETEQIDRQQVTGIEEEQLYHDEFFEIKGIRMRWALDLVQRNYLIQHRRIDCIGFTYPRYC